MTDSARLCVGCFQTEPAGSVCPACAYNESEARIPLFLPHRAVLEEQYLVGRALGRPGGFGITYLAFDLRLEDRVAIKEFLPPPLAGRHADRLLVQPHSTQDGEYFHFGLTAFNEEARTLAAFRHPNIVRVRTFFEANGTAYMVMDFNEGETLDQYLERRGGSISEQDALQLMDPIFGALSNEVHAKGYLHRDISPQNVYLASRGGVRRPLLIDFGAARQALGDRSQSLSVVLKPGYAPFEQYHTSGQGPWTDVYACAATLYRAVTGQTPPAAVDRAESDLLVPPDQRVPGLSRSFSEALVWGLAFRARDRPQTVDAFRGQLLSPVPSIPSPDGDGVPVLRGVQGELAGEEAALDGTVIIGREAAMSDLVIARGDLSRQHCAVHYDRDRGVFEIWDLESSNGTYVEIGGQARLLERGEMVELVSGDLFHLVDPSQRFEVGLLPADPDQIPTEDLPSYADSIQGSAALSERRASEAPLPSEPAPEAPREEPSSDSAAVVEPAPKERFSIGWWLLALLLAAAAVTAIVYFG